MIHYIYLLLLMGWLPFNLVYGAPQVAPQTPISSPGSSVIRFNHFKELQAKVLSAIGSAKRSIRLITDFLTDGEISSALYLAKYRKLDVKVYLGSQKVNQYLSRVNFLKQQGISVNLRPRLAVNDPTMLLVDHRLYRISRDLNVLQPQLPGHITLASPRLTQLIRKSLSNTTNNAKIITRPYPKVGRKQYPRSEKAWHKPYTGNSDGSYNYNRAPTHHRPEDVPTTLPKIPKYQQMSEEKLPIVEESVADTEEEAQKARKSSKDAAHKPHTIELIPPDHREKSLGQPFSEDH